MHVIRRDEMIRREDAIRRAELVFGARHADPRTAVNFTKLPGCSTTKWEARLQEILNARKMGRETKLSLRKTL